MPRLISGPAAKPSRQVPGHRLLLSHPAAMLGALRAVQCVGMGMQSTGLEGALLGAGTPAASASWSMGCMQGDKDQNNTGRWLRGLLLWYLHLS